VAAGDLSAEQRDVVRRRFVEAIFAALTPLAVDPGHPLPHLRSGAIHVAVLLRRADARRGRKGERHAVALVQIPRGMPRLVPVPAQDGIAAALLEEVVAEFAVLLFPGREVADAAAFRVTSERHPASEGHGERRPPRRTTARLEVLAGASEPLVAALAKALRLAPGDVDRVPGPLRPADLPPRNGGSGGAPRPDATPAPLRAG
jgi:polyphosphate kinase